MKELIKKIYSIVECFRWKTPFSCHLDRNIKLDDCILDGRNTVLNGARLTDCHLGFATFIGRNTSFYKTRVGSYCSIGEDVKLVFGNHPTQKIVSTHPAFYSAKGQYGFTYVNKSLISEYKYCNDDNLLEIGNDVWIGSYARIMSGIRIGDGAIIGAGAVVTKDVEPYSVVVGVPAEKKYKRFSDAQISALLEIKWWNKDENWLRNNIDMFSDIDKLLSGFDYE